MSKIERPLCELHGEDLAWCRPCLRGADDYHFERREMERETGKRWVGKG